MQTNNINEMLQNIDNMSQMSFTSPTIDLPKISRENDITFENNIIKTKIVCMSNDKENENNKFSKNSSADGLMNNRISNVCDDICTCINKEECDHKDIILDDLTKPWNYRIMLLLKNIGEKSLGYKWMHNEELLYYTKKYKYLTIIEVTLLAIIGTVTGSQIVTYFTEQSNILYMILLIIQTLFYLCYGITKAIKEAGDYPSKIYGHRWSSIKFGEIATDIQTQFCLPIDKRNKDEHFLEYKSKDFNDNLYGAPIIRHSTKKKYSDNIYPKKISKYAFDNVDHIDIIFDNNKNNISCDNKSNESNDNNSIKKYQTQPNKLIDDKFKYEIGRFFKMY